MAIENPDERNAPEQPGIDVVGKLQKISTSEIDWGTKVAYDITIRTLDPNALILGTLKAGTLLKVKVAPHGKAEKANERRKRK